MLGLTTAPITRRGPRRRICGVLACLLLITGGGLPVISAAAAPSAVSVPVLHWTGCGDGFQCTTAQVPLDYSHPSAASINLALIRLPASDQAHKIGSLFVNPGGPGGSGVDFARAVAHFLWGPQVRARFDIIGFDPRGVARSSPIQCFHTNAVEDNFLASTPIFPVGSQQVIQYISTFEHFDATCLAHNATIMQHMATADAARDLDLLRQAVGDRLLTYDGVSYGSYLGNTYANMFPEHVRALIIDGVLNPVKWATGTGDGFTVPFSTRLNSAHGAYETLLQFFALCKRGGPNCAFSTGDPKTRYYKLLARAREHPIVISGQQFTFADIVDLSLGALFSPFNWPQLAQILQQLYVNSSSAVASVQSFTRALRATSTSLYQNGLDSFLGVICTDTDNPSDPFVWPQAAAEQDESSPFFGSDWTYASEPCSTWPARDSSRYTGPFTHHTRNTVLVIGNFFDPATPYEGAQAVAGMLPNSRLLSLDGWGHTSLGKSSCISSYVSAYLIGQALPSAGTVCQPDFVPFQGSASATQSSSLPAAASLVPATITRGLPIA